MQAETNLLPTEPQTHTESKHWRECLLCEDYSLSNTQLHRFYTLKNDANVLFEQHQRWDLLNTLYSEYFAAPPQKSGKEWMRLGFQGQYPESDFRGGGVLSLQIILRFVRKNKPLVQLMEQDKAGFFFAITAINIAFYMKKYFHLADFLVPHKDMAIYCNRRALKNFVRILAENQWAYFDIHEILLKYFYNQLWVPAETRNAQTLLQFNSLFDTLTSKLKNTYEDNDLATFSDFVQAFDRTS